MSDYDGKNGHEFYDTSCELNIMMTIKNVVTDDPDDESDPPSGPPSP